MASLRSLQNTVFCCCNNTKNIVEGTRDDLAAPGCKPSMLPITPTPQGETTQAPGTDPSRLTLDEGVEPSLFTRW